MGIYPSATVKFRNQGRFCSSETPEGEFTPYLSPRSCGHWRPVGFLIAAPLHSLPTSFHQCLLCVSTSNALSVPLQRTPGSGFKSPAKSTMTSPRDPSRDADLLREPIPRLQSRSQLVSQLPMAAINGSRSMAFRHMVSESSVHAPFAML